ncbi:hypothetical protein [Anoxybacteroides tepidamans]|uniref:hypothetical protein n=1 Tax=Anoxybacteroides tepidamans TaxID=265948 RepID=UPI0004847E99|nr:hypothetical protein [Anoxybacillus tepidamans]
MFYHYLLFCVIYVIFVFAPFHFFMNLMIRSVIEANVFPNATFIVLLFSMILYFWGLGWAVRKYIDRLPRQERTKMKTLFIIAIFMAWIVDSLAWTI